MTKHVLTVLLVCINCSVWSNSFQMDYTLHYDSLKIDSSNYHIDSLYSPEELMLMDLPEICPSIVDVPKIYLPEFVMTNEYYIERYKEKDLLTKIVDNRGDGFDDLYGTRNLRPILHGVAYRGGANNYYHKTNKRKNSNPLPKDGLQNLCTEGFSHSVYLYRTNWESVEKSKSCNCLNNTENKLTYSQFDYFEREHIRQMMELIYESALNEHIGPIYLHCWNGWHASGFISAVILKQFCGFSDLDAVTYWDLGTDGANTSPRYNSIREKIMAFEPFPEFKLEDSLGNKICPPMPEIIDSSQLFLSLEHLLIVPEAIPIGTTLILNHIKFGPNKTSFSSPNSNEDLNLLLKALIKSPELQIEIGGHTDRSGNEIDNKQLSKERAKFVYKHLISKGVSKDKITYKGYGSSKPAYTNKTKTGRAANRRIEVKIINKKKENMNVLVSEEANNNTLSNLHSKLDASNNGKGIILSQIVFEPSETLINETGILQIDSLMVYLNSNPNLKMEIMGYTDISGIEEKNIPLSALRAKAVYDQLVEKGIDPKRLYYTGCGSENPIAPNKYEWGRDLNRRIEVVLLNK